jgi:class 3 adenylate cyclase
VTEADPTEAPRASPPTPAATLLFADIAGFTALTEAHGVVDEFHDGNRERG